MIHCIFYLISPKYVEPFISESGVILPHIRHVSRDVELSTWVKILLCAVDRWAQALIFHPAM